jgi:hypothetical protein
VLLVLPFVQVLWLLASLVVITKDCLMLFCWFLVLLEHYLIACMLLSSLLSFYFFCFGQFMAFARVRSHCCWVDLLVAVALLLLEVLVVVCVHACSWILSSRLASCSLLVHCLLASSVVSFVGLVLRASDDFVLLGSCCWLSFSSLV